MKLRTRLFLLSSIQLIVLGVVFAAGYIHFRRGELPVLKEHLHRKVRHAASILGSQLDVALGAHDPSLIEAAVTRVVGDPDFRYVEVQDDRGRALFQRGRRPDGELTGGEPKVAVESGDTVRAWAAVSLEGLHLGRVAVVLDTARVEEVRVWNERLALIAVILWCAAIVCSLRFSRAFVRPIRRMMEFSRTVASGQFDQRLSCGGSGELRELQDYLNAMAGELAARERLRHEAAQRAELMQRDLIAVSRMAGMAEVATGVLHNIGNALTSLNVSVSTLEEKIRGSRVSALARSVELYESEPGGLPALLGTERGKVFPQYLSSMTQHLVDEKELLLRELTSVARNVDHIKNIVARQQSYAHVTAHRERLDMSELLDDALKIGGGSFSRHGIELVKEYGDLPEVVTDRHKVMEIVVNLISNARHAIKETGRGGRITLRLRQSDEGLAIDVADTGIGIAAENLARIFRHGFTTRKNGHGFGLHSSANSAAELGGSLSAASDGPGHGATFTLHLPLVAPLRQAAEETSEPARIALAR
jgi:signal transduction histidine kinase